MDIFSIGHANVLLFSFPHNAQKLSFPCGFPPISLLNKRWEADNEIQMPSRPAMSPANFSVGHFFFFFFFYSLNKQQRWFDGSEQEAIFKWRHYLSGLAVVYSLISLLGFRAPIQYSNCLADDCLNMSQMPKVLSRSTPLRAESRLTLWPSFWGYERCGTRLFVIKCI